MSFVPSISPDYDHLFTLLNPLLNTFQVIPLSVLISFFFFLLLQTQRLNLLIRQSVFILTLILNLALKPQSDNHRRAPRTPTITLKLQRFLPMFIPTPRISNLRLRPKGWGLSYCTSSGYIFWDSVSRSIGPFISSKTNSEKASDAGLYMHLNLQDQSP